MVLAALLAASIGAAGDPASAAVAGQCSPGRFGNGQWPGACWRPYGPNSPFNLPVEPDPTPLPNSQAMVERMLAMGPIAEMVVAPKSGSDWYHPVFYAQPSDPAFTVHCTRSWGQCELEGLTVRVPDAARPADGGDAHMAVVDPTSTWEYDFWEVEDKPAGGGTLTIAWGGRTRLYGQGLGSDATAAHFGLLAGIIRAPEMQEGRIDHALFMMVGCTSHHYVHPAAGLAGSCADSTDAPPVGQRFWLAMTDAEIDALAVPGWKKTILRALSRYGAYVGDTGGNEAFTFQFESGRSYTSFGIEDPMVSFARQQTEGVIERDGTFYFDLGAGVDWRNRLRALAPPPAP